MLTTDWRTSPREYGIRIERGVRIPVDEGITLDGDVFRPDAPGKFPVILCAHPYSKDAQSMQIVPEANSYRRAFMESGDFNFYVRRGYAFVVMNIRGSFGSDGMFSNRNPDARAIQDIYEAIEWLAKRPWCDGNVGMFGVSYFSVVQKRVATLNPPHLKAIYAMYGWTDAYRDLFYHGGIFAYGFFQHWATNRGAGLKVENTLKKALGAKGYKDAVDALRKDRELMAVPFLANVINNADTPPFPLICEVLHHYLDDEFHNERAPDFTKSKIPATFGADWGMFGFHMPGDVRAYQRWGGPKRMFMGPPIYLDRPVYQYAYESLRWFDHYLKGMDTGLEADKPVKLFIIGSNEWKEADDFPVPGTRWTPFYLHRGGLLSEHEFWPNEGGTTFEDSPFFHGGAEWTTPKLVENTEICGPIALNFYGSTTDTDVFWFASLYVVDENGKASMLTRGWLRGSQRRLDARQSKPWQPIHLHTRREPLKPNEIYEFNLEIRPYGILLKAGQRLMLRLKCADDEKPTNFNELVAHGHIFRPTASHVTVHHDTDHPSHLLLPITRGNVVGTFVSGGDLPAP